MKEVIDKKTGAILFKPDPKDPNEVEIRRLNKRIIDLEKELSSVKNVLMKIVEELNMVTGKTGQY